MKPASLRYASLNKELARLHNILGERKQGNGYYQTTDAKYDDETKAWAMARIAILHAELKRQSCQDTTE